MGTVLEYLQKSVPEGGWKGLFTPAYMANPNVQDKRKFDDPSRTFQPVSNPEAYRNYLLGLTPSQFLAEARRNKSQYAHNVYTVQPKISGVPDTVYADTVFSEFKTDPGRITWLLSQVGQDPNWIPLFAPTPPPPISSGQTALLLGGIAVSALSGTGFFTEAIAGATGATASTTVATATPAASFSTAPASGGNVGFFDFLGTSSNYDVALADSIWSEGAASTLATDAATFAVEVGSNYDPVFADTVWGDLAGVGPTFSVGPTDVSTNWLGSFDKTWEVPTASFIPGTDAFSVVSNFGLNDLYNGIKTANNALKTVSQLSTVAQGPQQAARPIAAPQAQPQLSPQLSTRLDNNMAMMNPIPAPRYPAIRAAEINQQARAPINTGAVPAKPANATGATLNMSIGSLALAALAAYFILGK